MASNGVEEHREVEFKTVDSLTLRGKVYAAAERGPAVIITPGLNFPALNLYLDVAAAFQRAGVTALVYDNRCVGASDGEPRGESDPVKQIGDLHEAVSFVRRLPTVDPKRIALWGYSLSGACALSAAALDRRVKAVVAVCPAQPLDVENAARRNRYLALAIQDRESRARGNDPLTLPFVGLGDADDAVFNFRLFFGTDPGMMDPEVAVEGLEKAVPGYNNQIPVRALANIAAWSFRHLLPFIGNIPVLQVEAGDEELEYIKRQYGPVFEALVGPKERVVVPGKGHMDILSQDERFAGTVKVMSDFVLKHLG
ncbi:Alpha/Beta hydrolase protein [Cercophora newfieldiana]|uniref:Alpha/Beta hydrolase protein n=1 Tax=Cercophora newfieldiana TaxID=92897 RepID=A0AA40CIQ7_9PEZI|nr:Alpha/Beta hydrolase protein [Cercophora newfieldiana]